MRNKIIGLKWMILIAELFDCNGLTLNSVLCLLLAPWIKQYAFGSFLKINYTLIKYFKLLKSIMLMISNLRQVIKDSSSPQLLLMDASKFMLLLTSRIFLNGIKSIKSK